MPPKYLRRNRRSAVSSACAAQSAPKTASKPAPDSKLDRAAGPAPILAPVHVYGLAYALAAAPTPAPDSPTTALLGAHGVSAAEAVGAAEAAGAMGAAGAVSAVAVAVTTPGVDTPAGAAPPPDSLRVGQRARARHMASTFGISGTRWFPCVVVRVHSDSTADVQYDDGDAEERVFRRFIRPDRKQLGALLYAPRLDRSTARVDRAEPGSAGGTAPVRKREVAPGEGGRVCGTAFGSDASLIGAQAQLLQEVRLGYIACGINGCILSALHSGVCVCALGWVGPERQRRVRAKCAIERRGSSI